MRVNIADQVAEVIDRDHYSSHFTANKLGLVEPGRSPFCSRDTDVLRRNSPGRNLGRKKRGGDRVTAPFSALSSTDSVSQLLPPGSTTPSRVAGHRERATAMELALESLEPDLCTIVQLRLFEEVPMREIATQLSLPLSTAKERLLRGVTRYRRRLKQLLGNDSILGPASRDAAPADSALPGAAGRRSDA